MPTLLPDGVYESLVTQALQSAIDEVQQVGRSVQLNDLKAVEGTALLVRHLAAELGRRLGELPEEDRLTLCNQVLTSNGLERLHGEIKRRTNAVGAFPDRGSALRLVTAVALNVTAIWTDRRYLDMSMLKSKDVAVAKAA